MAQPPSTDRDPVLASLAARDRKVPVQAQAPDPEQGMEAGSRDGWDCSCARRCTSCAERRRGHHSVILEMTGTSVRADAAEHAKKEFVVDVTQRHVGSARRELWD